MGWGAGQEQPCKLVGIDGLDQRLADLWEGHPVKGIARNEFAPHQPVEEGPGRAGIGLDRALGAGLAAAARCCAQVGKPAVEIGRIDVLHQGDLAFLLQVGSHERQGRTMPFERFGAVVAAGVIEQVVGDGAFSRRSSAVPRPFSLALSSSRRRFGRAASSAVRRRASAWVSSLARWAVARASVTLREPVVARLFVGVDADGGGVPCAFFAFFWSRGSFEYIALCLLWGFWCARRQAEGDSERGRMSLSTFLRIIKPPAC